MTTEHLKLKGRVSVERAACNALAVYLQAEFDKLYGDEVPHERVVVSETFPEAGANLPPRAVSVVYAGTRRETHLNEEVVRKTDLPDNQAEFEWAIAAVTQPIQIDIWAQYDSVRDQLSADLDTILNRGPVYTLGIVNGSPVRDGVLLELDPDSGHSGKVDFTKLDGPRPIVDAEAVATNQFRALIGAELDVILTLKATSPKLVRVKLKGALDGAPSTTTLQKEGAAIVASAEL